VTSLTEKYADSIAEGRALEGRVWALALALAKDVQENGGTAAEATEALKEGGVTSTSGEPYERRWIGYLVKVGTMALGCHALTSYPVKRVGVAGEKHAWDEEAMLLALKGGETMHQIAGTSPLGKPNKDALIREADRLSAADKAALANVLVSQPEVREAILVSPAMAQEQHILLGGEIVKASTERSEEHVKTTFPSHAASDAASEVSEAARHLANAHAEVVRWSVSAGDDRLNRLGSAMSRVEQYVTDINEAIGRVAV